MANERYAVMVAVNDIAQIWASPGERMFMSAVFDRIRTGDDSKILATVDALRKAINLVV